MEQPIGGSRRFMRGGATIGRHRAGLAADSPLTALLRSGSRAAERARRRVGDL